MHNIKYRCYFVAALLCVFFWLANYSALAQNNNVQTIKEYYDFEKKLIKNLFSANKSGKKTGSFISYFPNGLIASSGQYEDNKPEGVWEFFYENGEPKAQGYLHKGKKGGLWIFYFENGSKSQEGCFLNDIKDGEWTYYFESGKVKSKGVLKNNSNIGRWTYYNEEGDLKGTADYDKQIGRYKEYFPDGNLKSEGRTVNGASDSIWIYYYPNGAIQARGLEVNGKKNGHWQFFHKDKSLSAEGRYTNGMQTGEWVYYHPNGVISSKGIMDEGRKDGIWNLYYETGKFMGEGVFENGDGFYKEYYEDGKLKIEGNIKNGNYIGLWNFYFQDGRQEGFCQYDDNGEGIYTGYFTDGSKKISGKLKNGEKTGVWRLYTQDGQLAGLYKTYFEAEGISQNAINKTIKADSTLSKPSLASKTTSISIPTERAHFFRSKVNEVKGWIIGGNPLATVMDELPVSLERYFGTRLGYEFRITAHKSPFFQNHERIINQIVNDFLYTGFALDFRQKLYYPSYLKGNPLYISQEVRYKLLQFQTANNIIDVAGKRQTNLAIQHNWEVASTIGKRFFKEYNMKNTLTIDIFLGGGFGYRKNFNTSGTEKPFVYLKREGLYLTPRVGFQIGYLY